MLESAITAKGQTTLPKSVRTSLNLGPGDRVRYIVVGQEVRLVKARSVMELAGLLHRPGDAPKSLADIEAAISAGAVGTDS
jgi:AbrB family looped-hinge helix DNA binding protein